MSTPPGAPPPFPKGYNPRTVETKVPPRVPTAQIAVTNLPPVAKRRKPLSRNVWLAIIVGSLLAIVASIVVLSLHEGKRTLTVLFALFDPEGVASCVTGGSGGYDDIGPGMPIKVRNEEGTLIASGFLPDSGEDTSSGCIWTVKLEVPDAEQYVIEGGDRGELAYSREELEQEGWIASLTLGM